MKAITLEEHFVSPGFLAGPGKDFIGLIRSRGPVGEQIFQRLSEIGPRRIAEMDAAGIDMQILSVNSPGIEQADAADQATLAAEVNDYVAAAVGAYPDRFSAFAALPIATPDKAALELERRIRNGHFVGTLINGHTRGRYLDDRFFWPVLECAERLGVPLYLHPTLPPKPVVDASYAGFAPAVSAVFATGGWGWHIETANHLLRMILGGVFDQFPKLQVILGHLGEGIPFMLPRINKNLPKAVTKLDRSVAEYLRQNVHYTFGGFNFPATFANLLQEVGIERIMFSVDYPFGSMSEARDFLNSLPITKDQREKIASGNAHALLHLK